MRATRKNLVIALAMIVGGLLAFIAFLAVMDPSDERPLGALGWVVGGILLGPGFGYLLKWSKQRSLDRERR